MTTQQSEMDVLKAQVKTLKRMFYGTACLLVAGIALAATSMQGVPDVIQGKKFEVVNDEGKAMALLSSGPDGGILVINNKDKKDVVGLSAQPDGGLLGINNKDGEIVVGLGSDPDGGGALDIYGKDEAVTFKAP